MWESIVATIKDFGEQWGRLSTGRKISFSIVLFILISCMVALGVWVGEKSYSPLYTNLAPEASIALVKVLQEEKIPYLMSENGTTISIPPEFVQPTLMKLAVKGMPGGQKPGLELFDKESFGTSSYVQRINYVRALQGELTRTINTLKPVNKSTVHISMPPKSSFLEQSEDPKASVVLELHPGSVITKQEARGIQNLVAASVEGLRSERVTVVDSTGRALTSVGDALSAMSSTMVERQQQVQSELERRVEDIVSRIVGNGNVIARINADLDFDPMREHETLYDPEQTALKSQQKQENTADMQQSSPAPQVAGAQSALPAPASTPNNPETRQNISKTGDRSDFEVSSKVRNKEKALGGVKRLSVAVLVNGNEVTVDKEGKKTSKPMPEDRRQAIEKLVKDAVGFTVSRGDSVTIESSAFASEDLDKADEMLAQRERRELLFSLVRYGSVAFLVFLFFMIVVRPFIRWLTGLSANKVETILPKTVEELEQMQDPQTKALPGLSNLPLLEETVDIEKAENELLKEKIISLINLSPNKAGQVISDWMALDLPNQQQKKGRR